MKRQAPLKDRITALCNKHYNYPPIEYSLELLPSVKRAIGGKNGKIYARVETVSRSGMSRTVSLFIVHKGDMVNLNNTVYRYVYGDTVTRDGKVRIGGCGMDMLFECTYRMFNFLYSRRVRYQNRLNRYRGI